MRVVFKKHSDKVLGIINEATVQTLLTRKKSVIAAVPNKYHGIKTKQFDSMSAAAEWITKEANK